MLKNFTWNMSGYIPKYPVDPSADGIRPYIAERIFQLEPVPPKVDNPNEYIRRKDIDSIRHSELVLQLAKQQKTVSRKDVIDLLHITPPQAYRLLQKLVLEDKLIPIGRGAGAKYIPK